MPAPKQEFLEGKRQLEMMAVTLQTKLPRCTGEFDPVHTQSLKDAADEPAVESDFLFVCSFVIRRVRNNWVCFCRKNRSLLGFCGLSAGGGDRLV